MPCVYMCKKRLDGVTLYATNIFEYPYKYDCQQYFEKLILNPCWFLLIIVSKNNFHYNDIEKLLKFELLEESIQLDIEFLNNKTTIDYEIDDSLVFLFLLVLLRLLEEEGIRKSMNPLHYAFSINIKDKKYCIWVNDNDYLELLRKIFKNKHLTIRNFMGKYLKTNI